MCMYMCIYIYIYIYVYILTFCFVALIPHPIAQKTETALEHKTASHRLAQHISATAQACSRHTKTRSTLAPGASKLAPNASKLASRASKSVRKRPS